MLHFQPAYLDILPMYIALLVLFAVVMPLLRSPQLLALASFALYATARLAGLNLPSITGEGWYFNPLTWQLLFMLGAIMAYLPPEKPTRQVTIGLDVISGLLILFGLVMQFGVWAHPQIAAHLPDRVSRILLSVDKGGLHPFRLTSILALVWVVSRTVPPGARWISSKWAAPFVLCGQHSLPVFCSGIFLSFLGRALMEDVDGWWIQIPVDVIGATALVGVGALSAYYREKGRPAPRQLAGGVTP